QPRRITATVFFSDLVGFTPIAEKFTPSELMDWLNVYMEAMSKEIFSNQGVVDKYMGDAIMALFGVPFGSDTEEGIALNARNAVIAALGMSAQLKLLNPIWQEQGLPTVGMRVGIFTGSLVAGSVGGADRMEYTVIGDAVNTAARLESYDKTYGVEDGGCRILIGKATKDYLGDAFVLKDVGMVNLKGKSEGVAIYQVMGFRQGSGLT
ncbi:MAG: adenylate/guanylate cyclase domain-containing protein, partial [Lentisphaeria bacterium]|nr:adenylate/guanylate cyclase domain-containing protein [Lentisphaeria bacterium]